MHLRVWMFAGWVIALPSASAFDYFEHRAIGNAAFRKLVPPAESSAARPVFDSAVAQLLDSPPGLQVTVFRKTFGDLTALAGDHVESAADLEKEFTDGRPEPRLAIGSRPNTWAAIARHIDAACRWAYRTHGAVVQRSLMNGGDCFAELAEGNASSPRRAAFAAAGYLPDREEQAAFEQLPQFVDLASNNRKHFPKFSWLAYVEHHQAALKAARCASMQANCTDPVKDRVRWFKDALFEEAMAQHFLQDSFASGHIGTEFGSCLWWLIKCDPPKALMLHTHDTLNRIGTPVRLSRPGAHLGMQEHDLEWTAFGDRSFFVPEAEFHRHVTTSTALASLQELVAALEDGKKSCGLCSASTFPTPGDAQQPPRPEQLVAEPLTRFESTPTSGMKFSRSPDPRVPDLPVEGLKLSLGVVTRQGHQGLLARLDYLRTTGDKLPSSFGFELSDIPNVGKTWSFAAGIYRPRLVSPASVAVRARFDRVIDVPHVSAAGELRHRKGVQMALPSVDLAYEFYRPVSAFFQFDVANYDFNQRRWIWLGRKGSRASFGVRVDLAAIH